MIHILSNISNAREKEREKKIQLRNKTFFVKHLNKAGIENDGHMFANMLIELKTTCKNKIILKQIASLVYF